MFPAPVVQTSKASDLKTASTACQSYWRSNPVMRPVNAVRG